MEVSDTTSLLAIVVYSALAVGWTGASLHEIIRSVILDFSSAEIDNIGPLKGMDEPPPTHDLLSSCGSAHVMGVMSSDPLQSLCTSRFPPTTLFPPNSDVLPNTSPENFQSASFVRRLAEALRVPYPEPDDIEMNRLGVAPSGARSESDGAAEDENDAVGIGPGALGRISGLLRSLASFLVAIALVVLAIGFLIAVSHPSLVVAWLSGQAH